MIRLSISRAMAVIALIATHLAALKAFVDGAEVPTLLTGLLPLADAHGAALYLVARRQRARRAGRRRYGVIAFTAFTGLSLIILLVASTVATDRVMDWVVTALDPVGGWLISLGYDLLELDTPLFQWFVVPSLVSVVLSGPPLVLGFAFGWLSSECGPLGVRRTAIPPAGRTA